MGQRTLLLGLGLLTACGSNDDDGAGGPGADLGSGSGAVDMTQPGPDQGPTDAGSEDMGPSFGPAQCDAVIEADCFLPYPSNLPIVEDPSSSSGFGLVYFPDALPVNSASRSFDGTALGFLDGVPPDISIVTAFEDLDGAGLPGEDAIADSLDEDASILLFQVNLQDFTLSRIPYWTELDVRSTDARDQALFIRPARLLEIGARYIIAFQGLRRSSGALIPRAPGFEALVEGTTAGTEIEDRQPNFDDLLNLLDGAGIDVERLQAAWDFRTGTRERQIFQTTQVLAAYRRWRAETELRFTGFVDEGGAPLAEQILFDEASPWTIQFNGVMFVPNFLTETGFEGMPVLGFPDPQQPQVVGEREIPFSIRLSKQALTEAGNPDAPILITSHPLGGSRGFLDAPQWAELAQTEPLILAMTDWTGLSETEGPLLQTAIADMNAFRFIAEASFQGWVQQLVLAEVAQAFMADPLLRSAVNVDPDSTGLLGVGLTGALGAGLVAASSVMERGVLVSAPSDLGLAFSRSEVLAPVFEGQGSLVEGYEKRTRAWIMTEVLRSFLSPLSNGALFDQLETPTGDFVGGRILWTAALSDARLSHLDMERTARSGQIPLMANYPRSVYEVETVPYPRGGSGAVVFDLGQGFPDPGARPPDTTPGDELLALPAHGAAVRSFVQTGTISDPCGGEPCRF